MVDQIRCYILFSMIRIRIQSHLVSDPDSVQHRPDPPIEGMISPRGIDPLYSDNDQFNFVCYITWINSANEKNTTLFLTGIYDRIDPFETLLKNGMRLKLSARTTLSAKFQAGHCSIKI
jgi:hypothetical protein